MALTIFFSISLHRPLYFSHSVLLRLLFSLFFCSYRWDELLLLRHSSTLSYRLRKDTIPPSQTEEEIHAGSDDANEEASAWEESIESSEDFLENPPADGYLECPYDSGEEEDGARSYDIADTFPHTNQKTPSESLLINNSAFSGGSVRSTASPCIVIISENDNRRSPLPNRWLYRFPSLSLSLSL